jgi:hypothetical protein
MIQGAWGFVWTIQTSTKTRQYPRFVKVLSNISPDLSNFERGMIQQFQQLVQLSKNRQDR